MHALYTASVFLHIAAACAWIGAMIFFAAVVVPVLRRPEYATVFAGLVRAVGGRFRVLGWSCLGVLLVTGATNLALRDIGFEALSSAAFWRSGFGHALAYKLAFVALVLVATGAHDALALRSRSVSTWLGRSTMVLSLVVVLFAVWLVRGLP